MKALKIKEFILKRPKKSPRQSCAELAGKTICPPPEEESLYIPNRLRITDAGIVADPKNKGLNRIEIKVDQALRKLENGTPSLVVKTKFYSNSDKDSIWSKFLVLEDAASLSTSKAEISLYNSLRNSTHCFGCKKPLKPMVGMLLW